MSWKSIIKEITEDTNIKERDELTSTLERMTRVFRFPPLAVSERNSDEGYDFYTRQKQINTKEKIQELLDLYEKNFTDHYISEYRGSGEIGYHIDIMLGEGENRFAFEMYFGHFGDHYIHLRGVKRLDKKESDFLNKLMSIIE